MAQKFIQSCQKTTRKKPQFQDEKPKKFARKPSDRDRSFDSKKSKESAVFSQYIRNPYNPSNVKICLNNDQSFLFPDEARLETDRKPRRTMPHRNNKNVQLSRQQATLSLRIKILQTQLKSKEGQCERYRLQLDEQKQRRRKLQFDRKAATKEAAAYQKQNQELLTQIKKLNKQKDILNKQIQFLQKINYDEKARNILSFRQKHMRDQIEMLKEKVASKKSMQETEYLSQLSDMKYKKEVAQQKVRSMQSLVDVQKRCIKRLKQILKQEKILTKERILNSDEFIELRDRLKKFIDQYKEVRLQNTNMKALLQNRETQLVLSQQEDQFF